MNMENTARQAHVELMKPEPISLDDFNALVGLTVASHTHEEILHMFSEKPMGCFDLDGCVLWAAFDVGYPPEDLRPSTLYYEAYKRHLK